MSFSSWKLSTAKGTETILMDNLVLEIIDRLYDKIEVINQVKKEFELNSVLEIVMDVDLNEEQSTPALGHDLKVIEFLYKTQTRTDVDIYRYNSAQTISKPHQ
jgi:CRISPR-associated protein Cas8b1/Cst1 subtype I-B